MNRFKKILAAALLLICVAIPLYAESQRSYPADDLIIDLMRSLYVAEGKALPSTTGPWTKDELMLMLGRINPDTLGNASRRLYDSIEFYLTSFNANKFEENLELDLELYTRLESFNHSNPADFGHIDKWGIPGYKVPDPVLAAEVSLGLYDRFFLFMDPSIGLVRNFHDPDALKRAYSFTNMILLPPAETLDSSANTPQRAYSSFGGHGWNFLLGREKVSWGPGHTGNFVFGDHIPYHDMFRVTGYTDSFKYTFITSFLIHPQNYFMQLPEELTGVDFPVFGFNPNFGQSSWMNGISMYMHHRFEWRIKDKVGLAITEGILYQHPENYLDLRVLNPMMIFHNLYMKQYSNSLLNVDFDWTFAPGWNWYVSLGIDDLAVPFVENNPDVKGSASPNAIGILTGINMSLPKESGFWMGNLEFAYTDPYLYLRDKGIANAEHGERDYSYGLSFLTGIREYGSEEGSKYDLVWLGYKFGGDAIVASIDAGWSSYDGWGVGGSIFYMAHGINDIRSIWKPIEVGSKGSGAPSTEGGEWYPTIDEVDKEGKPSKITKHQASDAVSHTLVTGIHGYYSITWNMILNAELNLVTVWHPDNISTRPPEFDAQFMLGFSISY